MEELWRRIEPVLANLGFELPPGASHDDVVRAEQVLGISLPADYRESVRIHDGTFDYLIEDWQLDTLVDIVKGRSMFDALVADGSLSLGDVFRVQTDGPVRPQRWNRAWIPIGSNTSSDHLLLDLDPPAGGTRGQLLRLTHEAGKVTVIAPTFRAFLARFADDLEHDRYEAVRDGDVVIEWHKRS